LEFKCSVKFDGKENWDMSLDTLDVEIAAFDKAPPHAKSADKPVVVFRNGEAQEWFKSVNEAYLWAKDRFAPNTYLIRDVFEETPFLPLFVVGTEIIVGRSLAH
jgi:hypothetical protein